MVLPRALLGSLLQRTPRFMFKFILGALAIVALIAM